MEQMRYLHVPGWDRFGPAEVKGLDCSCKPVSGYSSNNGNLSNMKNMNNNSTSGSNNGLTSNERCCCDINANDKYTAAIELSNKCREFYNSRLEAANSIKSRWRVRPRDQISTDNLSPSLSQQKHSSRSSDSSSVSSVPASSPSSSSSTSLPSSTLTSSSSQINGTNIEKDNDNNTPSEPGKTRRHNSIDQAMDRLRIEMVSLMEQDLSLMKQLLTLNETIEELKWQRQYYSCSTSCASLSPSGNLQSRAGDAAGSAWSVSDTEMYESDDDLRLLSSNGPGKTDAVATTAAQGATPTTASSSGTVTPMSSSSASLAMVQHHVQLPATGHVTGPTWHSTRKARKASRDSDRTSLDSLILRLDEGEGLAAEVQAALWKMDKSAGKNGDNSVYSSAFVDNYQNRPALSVEKNNQKDSKQTRSTLTYAVTPASPVLTGNSLKFTSDHLDLTPGPIIRHDRDQHSFDSGIHEPSLSQDIEWNV